MDVKCTNVIRCLAADTIRKANSGHPGAPLGLAPAAHVLFSKVMTFSSKSPDWINRDRFVLSNGHGSALLYSMLHLCGYSITMDDMKNFRQLNSITPGHPESDMTPGVEVTTGPLGQGVANGVGMAIAQANLAETYNKEGYPIFDHHIYIVVGDGCMQEGIASEAASLAGHLGLGRIIVLYDDNHITIDGDTNVSFTENVLKRFDAYNWHTQVVENGDGDFDGIKAAIEKAKVEVDKPSIIALKTKIGFGSKMEGTPKVHGTPLPEDDIKNLKKKFGFDPEVKFFVPDDVRAIFEAAANEGSVKENLWKELFAKYGKDYPKESAEIQRRMKGELPENWKDLFPTFDKSMYPIATRKLSNIVLNTIGKDLPELIGGSADLYASNLTFMKHSGVIQKGDYANSNIQYGIREHAMAGISNGISAYGFFIPFCSSFLTFLGYAMGSLRISSLAQHQVLYVFTHDSIGVGEDGPTHQPVEFFAFCRAMPNLNLFRPGDGNETNGSYAVALENKETPSVIALSRQGLPFVEGTDAGSVSKGGYILKKCEKSELVLIGTGTELHLCTEAASILSEKHGMCVDVVSMPCVDLFMQQPKEYRDTVLKPDIPRISVEAGVTFGWEGLVCHAIGINRYGASAPYSEIYEDLGITTEAVVAKAIEMRAQKC